MQKIIKNILAQVIRLCLAFPDMNTTLEEQLENAKATLEVLDPSLKLMKPEFRHAAARQLVYIAEQIAARYNAPDAVTEPEPESSEPAEPDHSVIDLAMKYRTRDGHYVTGLRWDGVGLYPYVGYAKGHLRSWTKNGVWCTTSDSHPLDLIPTGEPA